MVKLEKRSSSHERRITAFSSNSRLKRKRESYDSEKNLDRSVKSIYVFPVPKSYSNLDVKSMFEEFGHVAHVNLLKQSIKGGTPCFVDFRHHDAAARAREAFNGILLRNVFDVFSHRDDCLIVKFSNRKRKKRKLAPRGVKAESRIVPVRSITDKPMRNFSKTSVYVCPVAAEVSERLLEKTFSHFGRIRKVTRLTKKGRRLGRSTSYPAFVEFENETSAQNAVEAFNGLSANKVFLGHQSTEVLAVRFAELTSSQTRRDQQCQNEIYVFPLPQYIKDGELKRMFIRFGDIASVKIINRSRKKSNPNAGIPAFVFFKDPEAASQAVHEYHGARLEDVLESYRGGDILVVKFPVRSRADRRPRRSSRKDQGVYRDARHDLSMNVSGPEEMDFSIEANSPPSRIRRPQIPSASLLANRYYRERPAFEREASIPTITDDLDHNDSEDLDLARKEYELLASLATVRKDRLALRKAREYRSRRR